MLISGYFMTSVARDYSPMKSILISAAAFCLFNYSDALLSPVSIINDFLLGFFLGLYVFKRGNIIGATLIQAMWSFTQSCIFGTAVSGEPIIPSVFAAKSDGALWILSGGEYGSKSGIFATVVLTVAIFLLLLTKTKKGEASEFDF